MSEVLKLVEERGIVTSKELSEITGNNIVSIINNLNVLIKWAEIDFIDFHRRRLYVKREICDNKNDFRG